VIIGDGLIKITCFADIPTVGGIRSLLVTNSSITLWWEYPQNSYVEILGFQVSSVEELIFIVTEKHDNCLIFNIECLILNIQCHVYVYTLNQSKARNDSKIIIFVL